jgi:LmbE family N-acetylglucosaminyl deacetylase
LTTHQFYSLKNDTPPEVKMHELWYYCLSEQQAPATEWTSYYTAIGRDKHHINRTIDISDVLERKYAVMDAHVSQVADATMQKQLGDELLSREHFHVVS